jgi:signal peptidase I
VTVRPVTTGAVTRGGAELRQRRRPLRDLANARPPGDLGAPAVGVGRGRLLALRRLGDGLALGLILGLALATVGPLAFGGRSFAVLSGSMQPTLRVGDLVLEKRTVAVEIHVGDIVTFRSPEDSSKLITHRVRRVAIADGVVKVATKGDANLSVEHWTIPADGTVGRAIVRVPKIGYLLVWTRSTPGRLLLIALPACLLGASQLRRIWSTPTKAPTDAVA